MVQVKKASKYGRYFLFLAVASLVSFIWSNKDGGQSSVLPTVPHAYADIPGSTGDTVSSDDGGGGGGGGGDCDDGGGGCD